METYVNYFPNIGKEALTSIHLYFGGQECCEPGHSFGPAIRKHYLVHFIESGCGTFTSENQSYSLHTGDAFLIYPDTLTYYEADFEHPWSYSWIAFDGHEASYILERCGFTKEHPICKIQYVDECLKEVNFLTSHLADVSLNEFTLIASLFNIFSYLYMGSPVNHESSSSEYVSKAISYLNHNYEYPVKLSTLADYIGIERTYLYRVFHKELGISPQEYLLKIRIEAGCQLLQNTSMSITEIALSCGFKDSSSFCRSFRKECGCSPLDYRKNHNIT